MLANPQSLMTAKINEHTIARLNKLKLILTFGLLFIVIITPLLFSMSFIQQQKARWLSCTTNTKQKGPHITHKGVEKRLGTY